MIKWCAYCQRFITELEPYQNFVLSHGVCPECAPKVLDFSAENRLALAGVRAFFVALQTRSLPGPGEDFQAVLAESRRLGIAPVDLMVGILQPLLRQIGERWAAGAATVAEEHRFSTLARALVAALGPPPGAATGPLDLLLLPARGNLHTLGVEMAGAICAGIGLAAQVATAGMATPALLDCLAEFRPRAVGLSVALPDQMAQVREVAEALDGMPGPQPMVLVSGNAVRMGQYAALPGSVRPLADVRELKRVLGEAS